MKSENEEEGEKHAVKDNLQKKAKKRKHILVVSTEEIEEQVKGKKKKTIEPDTKNKKSKVDKNGVMLETPEGEEAKGKKRRTSADSEEDGSELGTIQNKVNNKKSKEASEEKVHKKKKEKSAESEIIVIDEVETEPKTKGKKEKRRQASVEVSEVKDTVPKKKKKRGKGEEEEASELKCEEVQEHCSEPAGKKSKKKKKSSTEEETPVENVSSLTSAEKKKIKEEPEDQHEPDNVLDVVFLSKKTGNADEVNINQERRQSLQMEVDNASQPPAKPTGLGQWSTAEFNSSEKQQKFLRLMGGFKKGFQPASDSSRAANMALGKGAQEQLQQGLVGEFERAQSRRIDFSNRGTGLGFTPASNKKFSIDIHSSRSVRFDD
ncbi:hypothetical protein KUCAC02_015828 [Chaenocephalus aceratus]|uniref:Uncharacterized protein n=1 Tax=Chaenocephalus aceratus TaxID=36190 RepID=A0ACB9XZX6_CHAAC|nr:hypothetical protein KUCAC02_015828 [Chaenocephalus aceratus]